MRGEFRHQVSKPLGGHRLGRVHAFQVVLRRRVRTDDRTGVRTCSRWNLPEWSLSLVAHSCDSRRVLAYKPGPEWKRHLREGTVGDVFTRIRVLVHPGPHVTRVDADDGDVAGSKLCCECF